MSDVPILKTRQARYGKTRKKTITLTENGTAAILYYAKSNGLDFSVAIESLALMSLGQTTAETLPRLVANVLERTIQWQFNRFAKLLSQTILAAEATNYKVDVLLLQMLWEQALLDPNKFVQKMQVSHDPDLEPDATVRAVRREIQKHAHEAAIHRLKKTLGPDEPMLPRADSNETT